MLQYWSLVIFRSLGQGHVSIPHLAKRITQEFFVSEASNLVQTVLNDYLMPIDIQVNGSEFKIKGHVMSPIPCATNNSRRLVQEVFYGTSMSKLV